LKEEPALRTGRRFAFFARKPVRAVSWGLAELCDDRPDRGVDPWHREYVLHTGEHNVDLVVLSLGPDGLEGTADDIVVGGRRKR
jgi:hypothetical protein